MSTMTGIVNANQALAAEDLEGDLFEVVGGKITAKKFTAPVPAGKPALVPSPDRTPVDEFDGNGDVIGSLPATPDNAVLNADGTWQVPPPIPQTRARVNLGYPQNLPSTVSPPTSGITQNFPAPIAGQQFYTPQLTIDEQASVPLPIPIYPVLAAGAQPSTSGAYGLLPVAGTLAGRADVVFTSDGKWRVLPTAPAPAPTTNALTYFPTTGSSGAALGSTVNGVLSTVPIAAIVSCTNISDAYTTAPQAPTAASVILGKNCQSFTLAQLSAALTPTTTVSNTVSGAGTTRLLTTTVNGVTSAAVDISDKDMQALSIAGNVITLTNGGSVTLPAVPATTHVNAWTKAGGLAESVDSIASNIAIPVASPIGSMTDFIGYNAAGTPVNTPVPRTVRIQEEYKAVAASTTHAIIGPNADALYDTYFISTLIEVTAAGVTYTLPVVPLTIGLAIHSIEIDVKCTGSWVGTVSVAAPAGVTVDGAAAYSFTKAAATGVNAQPSRTFRYSLSAAKWLVV